MRKICFFTGTRAEYGIMSRLMRMVADDEELCLQIIATNMHLSPEFGLTYKEIEADGFKIDKKVEMLLSSDTAVGTLKSMGLATIGFAEALEELKPDMAVILGDRYEMLAAAQSCLISRIPVAHLYGGEITEGAYDDAIRHAITKLSNLHFTSTEEYRNRVIQMGEQPSMVYNVGSLGVENITKEEIMPLEELEDSLGFKLGKKYVVVTFHPITMEQGTAVRQCNALLGALEQIISDYKVLFTLPNSDSEGREVMKVIKSFVERHKDYCIAVTSLGKKRYYSALKYSSAVIGNSSSGLVEAPTFGIPTLNIGNRQKGRTKGTSVIDCEPTQEAIVKGLDKVLSEELAMLRTSTNPYYKENTCQIIFDTLKNMDLSSLREKHFYDK